jgi:DNA invertase Pin-like site-specific DNA recombinase
MKSLHDDMVAATPLPAIHYGRVSTDKQEMERQDRTLELYSSTHRHNVLTRLADPDVSGSIPFAERESGGELLELLEQFKGQSVQIITTEQDRIGRDTIDQIQTIRRIWAAGAIPHFVLEGGPLPRTDENEFKMEIRASIAQYERNKIKSRIKDKFRGKRAANELCGTVTFGWNVRYTFGDGTVVERPTAFTRIDREVAERAHGGILRTEMVDNAGEQKWLLWMVAHGGSAWQVARELNQAGVKTKRAGEVLTVVCDPDTPGARPNKRGNGWVIDRPASGLWQAEQVTTLLASTTVRQWLDKQNL